MEAAQVKIGAIVRVQGLAFEGEIVAPGISGPRHVWVKFSESREPTTMLFEYLDLVSELDAELDGKIELPELPIWSHRKPKTPGFYVHNDGQVSTPVEIRKDSLGRFVVLFPGSEEEFRLARFSRSDKWRALGLS